MTNIDPSQTACAAGGCFVALIPGFLYTNVEGTLVNIALPSIEHALALSIGVVGWIPLAWLLVTGSLSPLAGVAADRIGRRRVYLTGLVTVAAGSVWAALSPSGPILVVGRVVQGIGASAIVANGLAIIAEQFAEDERGRVVGRMTALVAVGSIVAPVVGGAMAQYLGWRSIFWLETIGVLVGAFLVRNRLPRAERAPGRWWRSLPWGTAGALVVAATAVLVGLWGAGTWGPTSTQTLLSFAVAGLVGLYAFQRNRRPGTRLIEGRHISRRTAWILVTLAAGSGVLAGLGFALPMFLAHTAGLHGLRLGLEVLPFPLGLVAGALVGGHAGDRWGSAWPIMAGLVFTGVGLLAYGQAGHGVALGALAVTGLGLGAFSVGTNAEIIHGSSAGVGAITGLAGLVRRAGQVSGVAVATLVLQTAGPSAGVGWLSVGVVVALMAGAVGFWKPAATV